MNQRQSSREGEWGERGEPTAQMMPKLRKVWAQGDNFKQLHACNEGLHRFLFQNKSDLSLLEALGLKRGGAEFRFDFQLSLGQSSRHVK